MKAAVKPRRLESFVDVYTSCGEDFEVLLQDRLQKLEQALKLLGQLVDNVARRGAELESTRTDREGRAMTGPTDVHIPPVLFFRAISPSA